MNISAILSSRSFEQNPNYHLIYEWEEDISATLSIPIINAKPLYRKIIINRHTKKLIARLGINALEETNNLVSAMGKDAAKQNVSFVFELYVGTEPDFATSAVSIPLMIDFWKNTDLEQFYATYRNCKLIFISSLEAFNFLKQHNCPLPIEHVGLSLSDRFRLDEKTIFAKKYDILLAGRLNIRTNQVLRDYLEKFVVRFPKTEYLYQEEINGEYYYVSNQQGVIGKFHTRDAYINLLRASKISFYSTPGIDGGEKRTGGFNPVTPRYLELLSAQCLLLGKYPRNEETEFYELERVCPNIESYEAFETVLLGYLAQEHPSFVTHREILNKHYTSSRACQIAEIAKRY
jgi:hypothetical protein